MKVKTSNIKDAIVEYTTASAKAKKKVTVDVPGGVALLTDIVTVEKTDKGLEFSLGETSLCKYSSKAKRCYWAKKLAANIEVSDDVTVTEAIEEEGEERDTPVICKDRSRYEPYARGDRVSQDCADFVAKTLRSCEDVDDLMARGTDFLTEVEAALPKKSDAKNWIKHVAKWDGLNPGHRRMLMGCAIRTAERKADEADELKSFKKALKAAFSTK